MRIPHRILAARAAEGLVVFVAAAAAMGVLSAPVSVRTPELGAPQLAVLKDGTPRLHRYEFGRASPVVRVYDLDNKLIASLPWNRAGRETMDPAYVSRRRPTAVSSYRQSWRYNLGGSFDRDPVFAMRDDGYLVHYDEDTRLPDYYVSPEGFSQSPPGPGSRFGSIRAGDFWVGGDVRHYLLAADGVVYYVDPPGRRLAPIYRAEDGEPVAVLLQERSERDGAQAGYSYSVAYRFAVLDGDRLVQIEADDTVVAVAALSPEIARAKLIHFGLGEDGILAAWHDPRPGETGHVLVFDRTGKRIAAHQWTVPGDPASRAPQVVLVSVLWVVGAGLCLWHARRRALAPWKVAAWTAFALVTGPMGLAVYFGVNDFAALVRCPSCGKRRPVDREGCPRCGAAFAPPARTGAEIIEPV